MITQPGNQLSQAIGAQADTSDGQSGAAAQSDASGSPDVTTLMTIGWREWVSLPELGIPAIKAKVDTGAKTSAIHAIDIEPFQQTDGTDWVAFSILPIQRDTAIIKRCEAAVLDVRKVTDSGGHTSDRYFIVTQLRIGSLIRRIEVTLSQREDMLFRMLLGRTAMVPGIAVIPQLSYTQGRTRNARRLYTDDHKAGPS